MSNELVDSYSKNKKFNYDPAKNELCNFLLKSYLI